MNKERDIDLIIDGQKALREVFFFDGTEEFGEILDIGLYTFKPKELVLILQYDGETEKKTLEYLKDYVIYEIPLHDDGKSMEMRYEILLRDPPRRPATVTVVRPFFGSIDKERSFIDAQKAPDDRAEKGAHKSFKKKKPKHKAALEALTSSKIVDFILTFAMAVAVFTVAVNIFGLVPSTATTLMMVVIAIYNFLIMRK